MMIDYSEDTPRWFYGENFAINLDCVVLVQAVDFNGQVPTAYVVHHTASSEVIRLDARTGRELMKALEQ